MKLRRLCVLLMSLGLTVGTLGCGEDEDPPGGNNDTGAEDTEVADAGDTGDTVEPNDGRDAADTDVTESCLFQGTDQGVCTEGTRIAEGVDAGDAAVSGDGGVRCRAPDNYVADEAPPEDGDPPYDICDGLDNDCDGIADEGCPCDFLSRTEGICNQGTVSDQDGSCEPPEDYETDETTCDNVDNDCDGVKDEGCRCIFQGGDQNTGVCEQGDISAENGECEAPDDYVDEETGDHCDAKDNDCDGEVDEHEDCSCEPDEQESCYTGPSGTAGTGICETGTRTCQDGTWGECADETTPESSDTCDGEDNDCDGVTDEGCPCDYTGTSDGVCSNGQIGSQGNCKQPSNYEQDETSCDGVDNDCDGVVDEGCPCAYDGTSVGVCGDAKIDPDSGDCAEPDDYEDPEDSCDSKDNDCDGDVDADDSDVDECSCTAGESQSCYTGPSGTEGTGQCAAGSQTCQSDGTWDTCSGETTPSPESCDGDDNDCDGAVDEGCSCNYDMNSDGVCQNQTRNSSGDCPEPTAYEDPEATCDDNLDNDCDADTDCADSDCDGEACGSGSGATCQSGSCAEQQCEDGNDNDLDGNTDCHDSDCSCDGVCCPDGRCVALGVAC